MNNISIQYALENITLPLTDESNKKRNVSTFSLSHDETEDLFFYFDKDGNKILDIKEQKSMCRELKTIIKDDEILKKEWKDFLDLKAKTFFIKGASKKVNKLMQTITNMNLLSEDKKEAMIALMMMDSTDIVPIIPVLVNMLKNPKRNYGIRDALAHTLAKTGPKAVPYLINLIQDQNEEVSDRAALVFLYMQSVCQDAVCQDGSSAVPALRKLIIGKKSPNFVRINATKALGYIGKAGRAAIPELKKNLEEHMEDKLGQATLETLHEIVTPEDTILISLLLKALKYKKTADMAGLTLIKLREKAVYPLIDASRSDNVIARDWAVTAIGGIGPKAKAAERRLREIALGDQVEDIRFTAFWALSRICPRDRATALFILEEGLLKSGNDNHRAYYAKFLGKMGSVAAPAVYHFKSILINRTNSERLRLTVITALGNIGPAAKDAIPELQYIINDKPESREMHKYAKEALKKIK